MVQYQYQTLTWENKDHKLELGEVVQGYLLFPDSVIKYDIDCLFWEFIKLDGEDFQI